MFIKNAEWEGTNKKTSSKPEIRSINQDDSKDFSFKNNLDPRIY